MKPPHLLTHIPDPDAEPYTPDPRSAWRVKLAFRVDFTNGGHVEGEDFLLDIPGRDLSTERAAEILVSSMNLLRAGPVTIRSMHIVRRGEHDDL
ncbi:cyclase [Massilia arenae]|uniref:Cyclase n=1 Tax=Massilia arenae TaxID=2603288 RepID=A0A5C7FN11_9BURK|nr:cyclase [Massilia arenae]TXF95807.1 cyclase [Massilia arenae]